MKDWHGIIIDESQIDKGIFERLNILGHKKSSDAGWILYKIAVKDKELDETIKEIQNNMKDRYYFHFYKDNKVIVIFKKRIFNVTSNKTTWREVKKYGISLGIPAHQMELKPVKIEEETY